jgi:hypothetical protein
VESIAYGLNSGLDNHPYRGAIQNPSKHRLKDSFLQNHNNMAAPPSLPTLEGIPLHLRLMILGYLLSDIPVILPPALNPRLSDDLCQDGAPCSTIALLQTCRQFHDEAFKELYDQRTLLITISNKDLLRAIVCDVEVEWPSILSGIPELVKRLEKIAKALYQNRHELSRSGQI